MKVAAAAPDSVPAIKVGKGRITAAAADMPTLALLLSRLLRLSVLDQTGLTGRYQVAITYDPAEITLPVQPGLEVPRANSVDTANRAGGGPIYFHRLARAGWSQSCAQENDGLNCCHRLD
jgi:uncharacterized protein (TIGR03435 family)